MSDSTNPTSEPTSNPSSAPSGVSSSDEEMLKEEGVVHVYDGIGELDNQLPRWWLLLFYATIVFAPIYLVYFHVMGGPGQEEKYAAAAAQHEELLAKAQPDPAGPKANAEASTDEAVLAKGRTIFTTHCLACHLQDGGGLVGPNLCDDYWLNGPSFEENLNIIINGVPERGMIPWKTMLKPDDIHAVASYVYTLRGTTPAAAKPPEGKKYGENGEVVDEKPRAVLGAPVPGATGGTNAPPSGTNAPAPDAPDPAN